MSCFSPRAGVPAQRRLGDGQHAGGRGGAAGADAAARGLPADRPGRQLLLHGARGRHVRALQRKGKHPYVQALERQGPIGACPSMKKGKQASVGALERQGTISASPTMTRQATLCVSVRQARIIKCKPTMKRQAPLCVSVGKARINRRKCGQSWAEVRTSGGW